MKKIRVAMLVAGALALGLALGGLSIASAQNGTTPTGSRMTSSVDSSVTPSVPTTGGAGTDATVTPLPHRTSRMGVNHARRGMTYANTGSTTRRMMSGTSGSGSCGR